MLTRVLKCTNWNARKFSPHLSSKQVYPLMEVEIRPNLWVPSYLRFFQSIFTPHAKNCLAWRAFTIVNEKDSVCVGSRGSLIEYNRKPDVLWLVFVDQYMQQTEWCRRPRPWPTVSLGTQALVIFLFLSFKRPWLWPSCLQDDCCASWHVSVSGSKEVQQVEAGGSDRSPIWPVNALLESPPVDC